MSESNKSQFSDGKQEMVPSPWIGPRRAKMGEETWSRLDNFSRAMLETEDLDSNPEFLEMANNLAKMSKERAKQRTSSTQP